MIYLSTVFLSTDIDAMLFRSTGPISVQGR
jgi:hypothetical protein